jgi:hypothetical protein
VLKMLPFDNKSEYQVVVDMPAGTALEDTAAVLHELADWLACQPEVANVQGYAGTSAPITFNGLVRQYYLRAAATQGELQVNLVGAGHRREQSHAIAQRHRSALERIAAAHGARLKVVEVPPGPPVMSPIVAEVYGPDEAGRAELARRVARAFADAPDIVAIDTSLQDAAPRVFLRIERRRAESLGIAVQTIAQTVYAALSGSDAAWLHDGQAKMPVPVRLQLPREAQVGLDALLALPLRAADGRLVPLSELVTLQHGIIDQARYTKDLLPVHYVYGDMAGRTDSPLYGLFAIRTRLGEAALPDAGPLGEYWIRQPDDPWREYAIKWDGEWQVTYETFRDMGAAYAVGLVLIYLLVVAQFRSYLTPLIIMAPIPLTIIGVMPGHALLGAPFTATSMIGDRARDAVRAGGGALGGGARAAHRADRAGCDARCRLHPRRPDLQWPGHLADLRHRRLHAADPGGHSCPVLRRVPAAPRGRCSEPRFTRLTRGVHHDRRTLHPHPGRHRGAGLARAGRGGQPDLREQVVSRAYRFFRFQPVSVGFHGLLPAGDPAAPAWRARGGGRLPRRPPALTQRVALRSGAVVEPPPMADHPVPGPFPLALLRSRCPNVPLRCNT